MFVTIKDGLTENQIERQKVRRDGRYSKYPKCELCGKTIPPHKYSSDDRCNTTGRGLVLCKKCCIKSMELTNAEFVEAFHKDADLEYKKDALDRLNKNFPEHK